MEKKWRNRSMSETCDELLDKLPKISEYRKTVMEAFNNEHIIERLGNVKTFTPELQAEWQTAGNNLKHPETMIFYKGTSNILIKTNGSYVFTSLSALLLACYAYKYVGVLWGYQSVVKELLKDCDSENDVVAKEARDKKTGFLVDSIHNKVHDPKNADKILEFTTEYSTWGGAKTVDRNDFWVSTVYSTFNVVQSRSDIHTLIRYIATAETDSGKLVDNKLYRDTYKVVEETLNSNSDVDDNLPEVSAAETRTGGENVIFYGAPGTGKSYGITDYVKEIGVEDYDPQDDNDLVFRTTLHPEYEYSDFVGQLQPTVKENSSGKDDITYDFKPGVFTEALQRAYERYSDPVVLILEEMSRANVAGVFGDIFQLLDRDSNGRSEYSINNDLIADHIWKDPEHKVYIPSNLYIVGTVNTSDQNVFAMDTAFKRRFSWRYTPTVVTGNFENNPIIEIKGLDKPTHWKTFFTNLDDYIVNELELTEDKQIGAYFIKFPDGNDTTQDVVQKLLRDKLLQYLWQDVAINPQQTLFKDDIHSFSALYTKFDKEQVFSDDFLAHFNNDGD